MPFSLRRSLRPRALAPGRYLTDGRRLLRVLSRFDDGRSLMVLVEDCRTFDTYAYALAELRTLRFRRVRITGPAPARAAPQPDTDAILEGSGQAAV